METTKQEGDEKPRFARLPLLATQCDPFSSRARSPCPLPVREQARLFKGHCGIKTHTTTPYVCWRWREGQDSSAGKVLGGRGDTHKWVGFGVAYGLYLLFPDLWVFFGACSLSPVLFKAEGYSFVALTVPCAQVHSLGIVGVFRIMSC